MLGKVHVFLDELLPRRGVPPDKPNPLFDVRRRAWQFAKLGHRAPYGLKVATNKMNLADEVDLEDFVSRPDHISNADISAICLEAGMQAVRKNRYVILHKDFEKAYKSTIKKQHDEFEFYK